MPSSGLNAEKLGELARVGAGVVLKRLRAEIVAIERTFPELKPRRGRRAIRQGVKATTRRTRKISAAARKTVSERMKRLGRAPEGTGESQIVGFLARRPDQLT